jgi:hypothetical protein
MERRLFPVLLGAALFALACGSSRASDPVPDDRARAEDRLQGQWVLTQFQAAPRLEPMYESLLNAQLGQLTVTIRQGAMSIRGVGVQGERTYRIVDATDLGFSAIMTDSAGAEYQVTGAFQGLDIAFQSHTDPWRGTGRLHRVR